MAKQPKKPVGKLTRVVKEVPKNTAKDMRESFWKDSTNLSNATAKAKELIFKYEDPNLLMGGTKPSNEWQAAKDSISAISKRRQGDSEFWKKMSNKK